MIAFLCLANNIVLLFRQEMMRVREKQKEEEVETLKRSMQSGLVSFCFITFNCLSHVNFIQKIHFLTPFEFSGTSNERASSTQGRDGLPV